jgi:hypothetical protein
MKNLLKLLAIIALTVIIGFSFAACDYEPTGGGGTGNYKRFNWDIQGTWTTNDPESRYIGTLEITYNRITITGYGETQTPAFGGNDLERPFRNFTKGIALEGYTENVEETGEKIILIKDAGTWQEPIPYLYWYTNPPPDFKTVEFLRFTFGGRQETLRKKAL